MIYPAIQPPVIKPWGYPWKPRYVSSNKPDTPGSRTNVALSTVIVSRKVYPEVAGAISVGAGLEYEKNGSGTWTAVAGTLTADDYYRVRLTSSANYETEVTGTVTVDGTPYVFSVTTMAEPPSQFDDFTVAELDSMTVDEIDETIIP